MRCNQKSNIRKNCSMIFDFRPAFSIFSGKLDFVIIQMGEKIQNKKIEKEIEETFKKLKINTCRKNFSNFFFIIITGLLLK